MRRIALTFLSLCAWGWACANAASESAPPLLESAAAVRSLSVEEASSSRSVRLRGNLLLISPSPAALVLLDRGEGIYVKLGRGMDAGLALGDEIEVRGVTEAGDFAPIVRATSVVRHGPGQLPPSRPSSIAEINAGGFDAAWIELIGIVRSCVPASLDRSSSRSNAATAPLSRPSWLVTFAQGGDRVTVQINGILKPAELIDAQVRLRAVVFNVHNANRQFVRAYLQVPDAALVEVLTPPPADPFERPLQGVGDVLRFSRDGFSGHRVHVRGVVLGHLDGQTLWLRQGNRAMRIASSQRGELSPGDEVDVAGFPDHGNYTPSLSDAVFRRVATGEAPAPRLLQNDDEISRHDADLVQVFARLREVRETVDGTTLLLDWNGREVQARTLRPFPRAVIESWTPGSLLGVVGLCMVGQTDVRRSTGLWLAKDLELWLRSPADVATLRPAPWLTGRRLNFIVAGVALAALAALVVVAVVARRQLMQREEARKLAEVEFSAMLAERNRLARDIHDTLAQNLNAVSMQLELAKNAAKSGVVDPVVQPVSVAHEIVRKCLAEARESIWNMRSHILERNDLPGALRQVAQQLGAGSDCVIDLQVQGRLRRLAPALENNLLRLGQEAVSNSLKHAHARRIDIVVAFGDPQVRLVVQDDGVGLCATAADGSGHFGLRGMRERVLQMGGTLSVGPGPQGGTRVEVSVEAPG